MQLKNRQILFVKRPSGQLDIRSTFSHVTSTIDISQMSIDTVLVQVTHLSLDPAMRGWMNDTRSYVAPITIGQVMRAYGIGIVHTSNSSKYKKGDIVTGNTSLHHFNEMTHMNE